VFRERVAAEKKTGLLDDDFAERVKPIAQQFTSPSSLPFVFLQIL